MQQNTQKQLLSADMPDNDLVYEIARGYLPAFEILMRRYNLRLFRVSRSILKNDADAEDALQEAYCHAFQHIAGFRGQALFSTWLTRIVINESLIRLRKNRQWNNVIDLHENTSRAGQPEGFTMKTSTHSEPEHLAMQGEIRHLLETKIDTLPTSLRLVFILRAIEDIPATEVARMLDMPETTVRTRFFRARHFLQEALTREIEAAYGNVFSFDGERCDRIVSKVLARLQP
ncbi:MAG: RNA polymerase sigma factor [Alcaligenaceae bacterium]|nr:RNA polymerase sigma factor [Alcaligenaceae bacterium]